MNLLKQQGKVMQEHDKDSAWADTEPAQDFGDYDTYGTRLRLTKSPKKVNEIRAKRLQKKLARKKGRK
jgi:hypothetical protein